MEDWNEIIRLACPRAKAGLITIKVSDCEWCSAAEKAVQIAIQEERERCAIIAEEFIRTEENLAESLHREGDYIAKLIRKAQ
jgi:hypothetical protein